MRIIKIIGGLAIIAFGVWLLIASIQSILSGDWILFLGGLLVASFIIMLGLVLMFEAPKRFFKELFSNFYWW